METPINIPLTTTRQHHWRVVRLAAMVIGILAAGWTLSRAPFLIPPTSMQPANRSIVVNLHKSPATLALARGPLRGAPILEGAPWTLEDALLMSERELSIGVHEGSWSVVFDRELPKNTQASAKAFGLHVQSTDGTTIVSHGAVTLQKQAAIWQPSVLLPRTIGTLTSDELTARLLYKNKYSTVIIPNVTALARPTGNLALSTDNLVVAAGIPSGAFAHANLPLSTPGLSQLVNDMNTFGASLIFGEEQGNSRFTISIAHQGKGVNTVQDLSNIAREFVMSSLVKTAISTLPDGTWFEELRTEGVRVETREEEGFTFITATGNGQVARIANGPQTLTISNDPLTETGPLGSLEACGSSSQALIRPSALQMMNSDLTKYTPASLTSSLLSTSAISQRMNELRVCWE